MKCCLHVALVIVVFVASASAAVPRLCDVPAVLPDAQRRVLAAARAALVERRDKLHADAIAHNARCANIEAGTPEAARCAEEKRALEDSLHSYSDAALQFNGSVTDSVNREIDGLNRRIQSSRTQLSKFDSTLPGYDQSFQEWVQFGDDARAEARTGAKFTLLSVVLLKMGSGKSEAIKLNEKTLARMDTLYREGILCDSTRIKLPTLYASVLNKNGSLHTDEDAFRLVEVINTGLQTLPPSEKKDFEGQATVALKLFGLINREPRMALLLADGEIWIDTVYGWWATHAASERIDQLLALREEQLAGLKSMTELLKRQVETRGKLIAARDQLQTQASDPTGGSR